MKSYWRDVRERDEMLNARKYGIEDGCGIKSHFLATLNLQRYRPPFKSRIKIHAWLR